MSEFERDRIYPSLICLSVELKKQFREFTTFFYQEVYDKENQEYDHRLI